MISKAIPVRYRIVLLIPFFALAARSQGQTPPKVGFVDLALALQQTAEVKAEIDEVQKFVDSKNQESDTRIDAINNLRDQINQGTASDPAGLQRQLERLEVDFRRFQEDTQNEINARRDALFEAHGPKLTEVIIELARQENFDVIFPIDSEVAYVDESLILTSRVVALYDQKYPHP